MFSGFSTIFPFLRIPWDGRDGRDRLSVIGYWLSKFPLGAECVSIPASLTTAGIVTDCAPTVGYWIIRSVPLAGGPTCTERVPVPLK